MVAADAVKLLIINLPDAKGRRRLMEAQLAAPGMPPHAFIEGVDASALREDEVKALCAVKEESDRPIQLTVPEIACAASHLAAYRHISKERLKCAVVLEDDALLGHEFLKVLARLLPLVNPARPEAVLLCHVVRYSDWGARRIDKLHRLCMPYEAYGAHAYLITLAGAEAMLEKLGGVRTVADDWRHFSKARILNVSAVVPYVVGTAPISAASQIGEDRYKRESGPRLYKLLRKYLWQKMLFQAVVKPALRLRRAQQTW